uniref:THAP-type domain-containing protein n=1 Tax=Timema poppense TaxID=170557 RepID=A0A7R9HDK6_TIMPO|nr:unnamed protein product [Timema poppensis]
MPVVHTCSVTGCYGSSTINPGLTFFRFPTGDKLRYLKWVDFSQNPLLMTHREKFIYAHICASHFDASQFRTPLQDKLVHKAVPSIPALGLHPLPGSQKNPVPSPLQAASVQDPSPPSVSAASLPEFPSFSQDVPLSPLRESVCLSASVTSSDPLLDHSYCKPSFSDNSSLGVAFLQSSPPSSNH